MPVGWIVAAICLDEVLVLEQALEILQDLLAAGRAGDRGPECCGNRR